MPAVFALGAIVIFVALGSWQLHRKAWKEAVIESLEQRLSAPPVDLPPRERWATLDPAHELVDISFKKAGCFVEKPSNSNGSGK